MKDIKILKALFWKVHHYPRLKEFTFSSIIQIVKKNPQDLAFREEEGYIF